MSYLSTEMQDGVAVIRLDQPGARVNTLTRDMLGDLRAVLDRLGNDPQIRGAVIISGKEDNFIAGADIRSFAELHDQEEVVGLIREGQALLSRLELLAKPVVAAIHGACAGGGLELALACHYRLATRHKSTRFSLPEVQLGLLPGLGGTQRLPRLVGLAKGLELILSGKNVHPEPARKMGLIDATIHRQGLLEAAKRAALGLANETLKRNRRRASLVNIVLERSPLNSMLYSKALETMQKRTRGNYPAPPRIVEAIRTGIEKGMAAGLEAEARCFAELLFTPESRALIHLFFARNACRKNPRGELARAVETIGVIGAGLMGSGIAQVSAENGFEVLLGDRSFELAAAGKGRAYRQVSRRVGKGLGHFERDRIVERMVPLADEAPLARAELVIEAVVESLELKREVLRSIEDIVSEQCVFASNTSSIPIRELAAGARRPERVLGMHYFSPVPKMMLLEVVRGEKTADWALATAVEAGLRQGKVVIIVSDTPGFYTNRIMPMMMSEALTLLTEGADVKAVDRAMEDYGFPVGPITLLDEVGIDVAAKVTTVLEELLAARGIGDDGILQQLVEAGYLGRKSGKGFFRYQNGKKLEEIDTGIYRYFGGPHRKVVAESEIQERLSLMMINEAVRCLEEGVVASPRDGDVGAVFGLGFPPFRGGPFWYLDQLGARLAVEALERLAERHGPRFTPAELLRSYAEEGRSFYRN